MFEWLSNHRADISAVIIILLIAAFAASIYWGVKHTKMRENDEVFGDPERVHGGWYWAVTGISTLLLVWFFFSWGMARAYFPNAANELCQIGKIEEAMSPVTARLPIGERHYKSTTLAIRNAAQIEELKANMPIAAFTDGERQILTDVLNQKRRLIAILSDPARQSEETKAQFRAVTSKINGLADRLRGGYDGLTVTPEALNQPRWGVTDTEIPLLPMTPKGVLFDQVSVDVKAIAVEFLALRNNPQEAAGLIAKTGTEIEMLKANINAARWSESEIILRERYVKAVQRIFRRLDDGSIFPADALQGVNDSVENVFAAVGDAKGGLNVVDALFFPGHGVVKSRTLCIEQGSSRWLPKPTDVVAKFARLANPNLDDGGGYKGTTLLWWKWLPISNVVGFLIPDALVDVLPGDYGRHDVNGDFLPTYKDHLLSFAQGQVYLGSVPMLDGHVWDSLFRVLMAMGFGILLGVPLGIYMGVSRFFKSFFDPLIELYRPVPPLAWAPLILTIFGIQDDGKIFLLFMVAFAIMVISARTGASGTQLSKIRAAHSLGASNGQILRTVILPNALPEILTGVRIAIGVCWGTLVAAEMLAGTTGVGFIENVARTVSDYELIWVTILIMGLLGLLFDIMMRKIIGILIPWRGKG